MRSLSQLLKSTFSPVFGAKRSARRQRSRTSSTAAFVEICESRELLSNVSLGTLGSANLTTERPGNIAPADPVDNYTFTLATASQVRVAIHGMTQNLDVRLLGPDLTVHGSSTLSGINIDGFVTATIPGGSTVYTVQVFGESIGVDSDYVFQISSVATSDDVITNATPMNSSGLLDYGSSAIRSGTIGTAADFQDYYSFTLPVPQHSGFPGDPPPEDRYYISANLKGSGSTKMVELLDESGEVLVSRPAPFFSTTFDTYLSSGTYYIRVFATESTTQNYDLTVNTGSDFDLNRHTLDGIRTKRFTGVLDSTPGSGRYDFKLTNPAQVRAVLSGMTSNLTLQIRNAATGAVILTSNRSATIPESPVTPLLPAGEYYAQISGAAGSPYNLELTLDIDSDDTFVGAINGGTFSSLRPTYEFATPESGRSLQDFHRFTLQTTRDVRIRLSDFDRDLDVDLMNIDGVVLHSEQTSGNAEDFVKAGLPAGTYFVRVFRKTPLRNLNSNYSLGITQKPRPVAPSGVDSRFEMLEDTTRILQTANFPFTDVNTPSDSLLNVRITTLPAKGNLTLTTAAGATPVAAGQIIPAAAIAAGGLGYRPALNEFGIGYTSFAFEVQDNGLVFEGDADRDLTSNTLTFDVIASNDAPTLTSNRVAIPAIMEDSTGDNGELVSTISNVINDIDPGAVKGIAVFDAPTTKGRWQYALDGSNWQNIVVTNTSTSPRGLLLAADATTRVRFLPNTNVTGNVTGSASLAFRAWDQTSGTVGTVVGLSILNRSALSPTGAELTVNVTPVNDAPVLSTTGPVLPQIDEDVVYLPGPVSGVPIASLIGGVTEVDTNAKKGIAVIAASTTGGRWQYSLTNGETWFFMNDVTLGSALLLRDDASIRVRFKPNANSTSEGRLTFHAWDQTQGVNGGRFDLTGPNKTGGTTAFSVSSVTATQAISPINDAPRINVPEAQNTASNTPVVFTTINGNRLFVSDVDAGTSPVRLTISATNGTFTLPTTTGLTFVSGANGQSTFSLTGRVAAIYAALDGAFYTPNSRSFGSGSLTITVNDQGNSGAGGAKEVTASVAINVAMPSNTVDLGSLTAAAPTIRRSGDRSSLETEPDFYTFTLGAPSDIRVNLSGLSADLDVRVTRASGQLVDQGLLSSNAIENILLSALPAGTYLVAVLNSPSNYDLTISTAPTMDDLISQAIALSSPTAVTLPTVRQSATSSAADLQDYYNFNLTAASALRLNLSGLSQDADFELLDSAGRVIQTAGVSGNTIENMLTSTLAVGTYYVRVFAFTGLLTSSYDLTISTATTSDDLLTSPTSLGILGSQGSHRRTGSVAVGTDIQDYYAFVASGDVAISLSGLTSDVDLQVLDQFGRVLNSSTSGGNSFESINLNIPSGSGTIVIRVFAFSGSSNYVLEARANSNAANADDLLSTATVLPNPVTSLSRTGAVGGSGSTGDPQDYYRFSLSSIRNVTLTLTGLTADLDIDVLDQFGNVLFFSRSGGSSSETINMANLAIGTYFIRIYPFGTAISNYTLNLFV